MSVPEYTNIWRAVGASVQGAAHVRAGLPNQDAISWHPETGKGLPIILAISDGHGSAKSFRSDKGAHFAVNVALQVLGDFIKNQPGDLKWSERQERAQQELPEKIVKIWRQEINEDLTKNPFIASEFDRMIEQTGDSAPKTVQDNPFLAYGATLLVVAATEKFLLFLQIGDGDILGVDTYGETSRIFEHDERMIANETTSLCLASAEKEFRLKLLPPSESPVMVLVCTDGYSNSFRSEEGFMKIGQDYFQMIRNFGLDDVAVQLPDFLSATSQSGSGDDITLGILKRNELRGVDFGKRLENDLQQLNEKLDQTVSKAEFKIANTEEANARNEAQEQFRALLDAQISNLVLIQSKQSDLVNQLERSAEQTRGEVSAQFVSAHSQIDAVNQELQKQDTVTKAGLHELDIRSSGLEEKTLALEIEIQTSKKELIQQDDSLRYFRAAVEQADLQLQSRLDSAIHVGEEQLKNAVLNEQETRLSSEQALEKLIIGLQNSESANATRLNNLENHMTNIVTNLDELKTSVDKHIKEISAWQLKQARHSLWLQRWIFLLAFMILIALLVFVMFEGGKFNFT